MDFLTALCWVIVAMSGIIIIVLVFSIILFERSLKNAPYLCETCGSEMDPSIDRCTNVSCIRYF